jgi:predicted nucleic acid-binding protein
MTLDQVPAGARVFVDSNILVYHFQPHPSFGAMCHQLLERIERQDIEGYTSTNLLGELAHRLMVIEAGALPGWGGGKVLNHLKQQPGVVKLLTHFQTAVESVLQSKIQVLTIPPVLVSTAAALSRQHGLLTTDAGILALMQAQGLTHLASHDAHFDGLPGITRYSPQ